MQKQLLRILIPLLLLATASAADKAAPPTTADTASAPAAAKQTVLRKLDVRRGPDGVSIAITASAPVQPRVKTMSHPDRLVLDLPETTLGSPLRFRAVDADGIKSVRLGNHGTTARVVLDLSQKREYQVVSAGNTITVRLRSAARAASPAALAGKNSTLAPSRAVQPGLRPSKSAAGSAARPSPAARNAAGVKAASGMVEQRKPVPQASSAQDFVFVEPSYQSRPLANSRLLPPVSAAMQSEPAGRSDSQSSAQNGTQSSAVSPAQVSNPKPAPAEQQAPEKTSTQAAIQAAPQAPAPATPATQAPATTRIQPAVNLAAEQQKSGQVAAVSRPHYTGEPISVNLKDVDLKDFFRLVHEISGLNVVLDPNVHGSLTIVLDDVPWDQALDIVLKNNDLDRQLEGNVLRIATRDTLRHEAEDRRAQVEAEALAVDKVTVTRFLSYAHSKDVVLTVKKFLSQRGDVISDDRTNAVIISDIPSVIPTVDRLLTQLDRKTQEVEIEARVVAATRSFARDIGTQIGIGWGNRATAVGGPSAVGTSPATVNYTTAPPYFTIPGFNASSPSAQPLAIPLFSNFPAVGPTSGLALSNLGHAYRLDAFLTLAESRGLLKILSRPRVVTQNNIQALVRQGVRVPVVTQAQLGGPPTVTYVDAFLRLTVVPQITAENTIFLNVDVENTTPDFGHNINGNPTLITQQATTQVLVTDGGTVVIGGVIQTQNSLNQVQVPLLGNVPFLGNLFRKRSVSTSTQELIFFITPKIIQT